jgi:hypothetical protein
MLEYCESKAEKALLLVQERFAKRESKRFLASDLKSCAAGRSSNLYPSNAPHHSSIPLFQYSSWAETPEFDFSGILSGEERLFQ